MIDPADLHIDRKVVDSARCPVKDCPVSITEEREESSGETLEALAGYVRGKFIKAMDDHIAMAHQEETE
jgi:hypothetical protein